MRPALQEQAVLTIPSGPYDGMNDARQPNAVGRTEASLLENCYSEDTEFGPMVRGRPGFTLMDTQLGSSGKRTGQALYQFTKRDGTEYTVAICGGQFYTYNWGTDTFTESLTVAQMTAASITLSATARVYLTTFSDQLVVNDGVNAPWMWDGTAGAGMTRIDIDGSYGEAYGQPVVYYAKLFFIKGAARQTVVWSEEGNATTGYEAGGYSNAWDLVQSSTGGLVALAATNEALYYFREDAAGAITGAVTTNFSSTGTREAVDENFGTVSPAGVIVVGNDVFLPDQYGSFRRARLGSGMVEIGMGARVTMRALVKAELAEIVTVFDPDAELIRFFVPESGQTKPSIVINLHAGNLKVAGIDRGYKGEVLAILKDGSGYATLAHFGGTDASSAADGYAYFHGRQDGVVWDDGFNAGSAAIAHVWETGPLGFDTDTDKVFERFDLSVLLPTNLTNAAITLTTPRGSSTPVTLTTMSTGGGILGFFILDTDVLGGTTGEVHGRLTARRLGRWCKMRFDHATAGEQLEVVGVTARARVVDQRPVKY